MPLVGNKAKDPPSLDEVEISLFGPGYGECVLLHLGNGTWIVVDSCLDSKSRQAAPLQYLQEINVNPEDAIKLIIATHWHDDHVRAIGEVFAKAKSAKFVCSIALKNDEFIELVLSSDGLMTMSPGVREFREIMSLLEKRQAGQRPQSIGPVFAVSGKTLLKQSDPIPYEIQALSPSDGTVALAFNELSKLMSPGIIPKRGVVTQGPNNIAVALWITIGAHSILLGSDLEEEGNANTGWSAILDSEVRPSAKAAIFKVAHHGSKTAYHPRIWSDMLVMNPIAILTPFLNGNVRIPQQTEAQTILQHTDKAYISSIVKAKRPKWSDPLISKTIKETTINIREALGTTGHIRLRLKDPLSPSSTWTSELFSPACHLKDGHAA